MLKKYNFLFCISQRDTSPNNHFYNLFLIVTVFMLVINQNSYIPNPRMTPLVSCSLPETLYIICVWMWKYTVILHILIGLYFCIMLLDFAYSTATRFFNNNRVWLSLYLESFLIFL